MNKFRKLFILLVISLFSSLGGWAQNPSFDLEQYQKALWMTTRFYGAQRSGVGPNWLLASHTPTSVNVSWDKSKFVQGQSFVKDADGNYDLSGGWFDCGDHVKFGQTEFYSAYMLLLGYSEFPEGYDDYYSFDYSGYISADDYSWEGKKGKPNGIPDILDEVKYATDYLMKCVRDKSTFYYQVGEGDADHKHWVTASVMATLPVSEGGEADGSRKVSKATGNVTSMAALCGSALAAMARLYAPFDGEYAKKCLEKALVAYEFVNETPKGNSAAGGFYGSKPKYVADMVTFSVELYRTTGDKKYLADAEANCSWMEAETDYNYNYSLCYNNTEDLAAYLIASTKESSYSDKALEVLDFYVNSMYKPTSGYFLNKQVGAWGKLRFPANQAFVYGLYSKLKGELSSVNQYSLTTIEYIMGKNSGNLSYITGFGEKSPKYVHHRNYYREDTDKEAGVTVKDKFRQFGYLVGGNLDGSYSDVPGADYTYSEGGIDYNAGLVGALGYINSILNPVNTNKFGHPTPDLGADRTLCGLGSVTIEAAVDWSNLEEGEKVSFKWYRNDSHLASFDGKQSITVSEAGTYKCEVIESKGEWTTSSEVAVTDVLPDFTIGEDVELCKQTSARLAASVVGEGLTYSWSKDGAKIEEANDTIYTVYSAGTYSLTISATGCESKSAKVVVTSLLPEVEGDVICEPGYVNLSVLADGDYEWYDAPEGGTALGKGTSYSTKISESTVFYVQDAGSISATAGPSEKQLTNDRTYGDKIVYFSTSGEVQITQISVYYSSVYYGSMQTLTATLSGDDKGTFVSASQDVQKAGVYTFSFEQNPINITKAGNYSIEFKPENANFSYSTNCNYDEFAYSDIIKFNSGNANDYGFPALFDWKISAGSSCARTPVFAVIDENVPCDLVSVENAEEKALSLYPNPVDDNLFIDLSDEESLLNVKVYASSGAVFEVDADVEADKISLNVSQLSAGIYIVELITDSGVKRAQFLKR